MMTLGFIGTFEFELGDCHIVNNNDYRYKLIVWHISALPWKLATDY